VSSTARYQAEDGARDDERLHPAPGFRRAVKNLLVVARGPQQSLTRAPRLEQEIGDDDDAVTDRDDARADRGDERLRDVGQRRERRLDQLAGTEQAAQLDRECVLVAGQVGDKVGQSDDDDQGRACEHEDVRA
jgi:hypothetical protein